MKLEPIMQSEVSQKEKNRYRNAYIWSLERWCWWIYSQGSNRDRHRRQTVDLGGGGRKEWCAWGGKSRNIHHHTQNRANGNWPCDAQNPNQGSTTTQRGRMGREVRGRFKREGTPVYLWLIHVGAWQKPTQYCKSSILQLKINNFKF